jgi:D-glycero-alpha-D-manno-heptose 1-phosphate guanylyltransferase
VLPKAALNDFPLGQPFSIDTEFFVKHLHRIVINGFITHGRFTDIGVPEDYALAQNALAGL